MSPEIKLTLPDPNDSSGERIPIPEELSILPLRDTVLFPHTVLPLAVARESSVKLVEDAIERNRIIGIVTQKNAAIEDPEPADLYTHGTACIIHKMLRFPDGSLRLVVQGLVRIRIQEFLQRRPFYRAKVEVIREQAMKEKPIEVEALSRNAMNVFQKIVSLSPLLTDELQALVMNISDPGRLADFIASSLPSLSTETKQEILEAEDIKARLHKLNTALAKELEVLELGSKIQSQVQSEMGKNQKEYYLREQMKAIQRELGETDERTAEITQLREKIEAAGMPEEAKKEALRELDRLSKMPPAAAEYTVSRTYLDWLTALPWSKEDKQEIDISRAKEVLDADHYDLERVKDRILEYLAVHKIKPDVKDPILCFLGPPGVGKTSLGRSIARALGRKFIRISLGGMRDEAEIRGHRRTYIGALPGQIIQGIRRAESKNPVFMLDEVDKIGSDFRGDPASALLEVLDPEQNFSFRDHYLDVPFDLSGVLFIATANIVDPIPPALKDRMEILELPGYTEEEKMAIAERHLIPKQAEGHGLVLGKDIQFQPEAVQKIIREYTREAGLRNLEREIASICRKVAREIAEGQRVLVTVTAEAIEEFLGAPKYLTEEVEERTKTPGVAVGLAWTPAGGDILFVEATKMKGEKSLQLTGQLGEVMKESAQAALSWIRSHARELGIDEDFFRHYDLHLHVPEGAIPKDGPSAGVTMVTALASLLTGRPVKSGLAMTGEITLSGRVLPVGGIKEKVLAARRMGMKEIILPRANEKNLREDISQPILQELRFHLVSTVEEVLNIALTDERAAREENHSLEPEPEAAAAPTSGAL
jgi:ATP-dependent Lon protease